MVDKEDFFKMKVKIFSNLKRNINKFKWPHPILIKEQIQLNGYAIIENVINKTKVTKIKNEIDNLYKKEIKNFGFKKLKKINDLGIVRSPYLNSNLIADEIFSKLVLKINETFFHDQYILHVNRAVINSNKFLHPASIWHRDLPYQNFTTNNPVALTFIHFLNKNSGKNGGLKLLKNSHKWPTFPSDSYVFKNSETPDIKEGSLLVFDSALFHTASSNTLSTRRTLVTIFSSPLFKQQINLSKIVDFKKKNNYLKKIKNIKFILGLTTNPSYSDKEYRNKKLKTSKGIKLY